MALGPRLRGTTPVGWGQAELCRRPPSLYGSSLPCSGSASAETFFSLRVFHSE